MVRGFSETSTVQAAIVEQLVGLGWTYIAGKELPRTIDGVLIETHLTDALIRLNQVVAEDPSRIDEVLPKLRAALLSAANDGLVPANERLTTWLRGDQTMRFVGTDDDLPVQLIDFDDPANNTLVVSDEVSYGSPGHERRFDIVLWVNGLPLVVGETKTPVKASISWLNAARDIHNVYENEVPQFFVPNVLSFATEGREFHCGAIDQPAETWLLWGATTDPHTLAGWPRVQRSVELLLKPNTVLRILRDYTLFERSSRDGKPALIKLIPRYPQVEAVEAIHARVLDPDKSQGLVWHHQGTGKTLLMAFAAIRLLHDEDVGGPTVVIVLDRVDLVEQTYAQFRTAGLPRMRVAGTKDQLRTMLADDQRGIIVTTIFRFEGAGELNDRGNIVVLVDEAHRTQEGRLGTDMRTALPNAQFFGLTGTPISDKDRSTFKLFGDADDPGWVINQYSMERSIADGASVPVHVETRLVDFHVDREKLDEAFEVMVTEEELTDEERELLAAKATSMASFMRNPDRVAAVCADIVGHFYANVEPLGLKAQVVAFDRELCTLYDAEITRLLAMRTPALPGANGDGGGEDVVGPDEAAVVMTVGTSKSEPKGWKTKYELTREQETAVKQRFEDSTDPLKFLIVTAKLLTGFDAPIEGVMYLDKPLRLHTLFQAICRTNRRWQHPATGQEKRYGLIVDYVGLGNEIAKALQAADPETGGKRPVDIAGLVAELYAALDLAFERFAGIDRTDFSFDALHAAQQKIPPGDKRDAFAAEFAKVQALWEFLHPNPALDAHKNGYRWLAQVYESVRPSGVSDALLWHRLGAKTLALVHAHIGDVKVTGTGLDEVIVDDETIEAIRQLALPGTNTGGSEEPITVAEALDTIEARLQRRLAGSGNHAAYVSLAERLERLRRASLERAEASVEFLREILDLAKQLTAAEKVEDEGGVAALSLLPDPKVGALTQILNEYGPKDTPVIVEEVVADIDAIVRQVRFAGWAETQNGDRTVRREIRLVLKKFALPTTGELFDRTYAYIRENY
jgi:type I restriction enzyme, R subunit